LHTLSHDTPATTVQPSNRTPGRGESCPSGNSSKRNVSAGVKLGTRTQEETFYVLEGEMEFVTAGVTTRAAAGSLVRIPRGVLRDYRNVGSKPARVLVLYAPGGFEGFFEEVGELVTDHSAPPEDPPDVGKLVAAAAKYGSEIPPPPQE